MSRSGIANERRTYREWEPVDNDDYATFTKNCLQGSQALKEAIFRSWGIELRVVTPEPPKKAPKPKPFKERPQPRSGMSPGDRQRMKKIRVIDPEALSIAQHIAEHFGITMEDMRGPRRPYEISHPRQIAMYAIRKRRGLSWGDISFHFGGKDHTTIIYAIREVEKRIEAGDHDTIKALNMIHKVFGA